MTDNLSYDLRGTFTIPAPKLRVPEQPPASPGPTVTPATLSPDELADYLGCSRSHAYKILRDGNIPSFHIGRLRKVLRTDADAYLAKLRNASRGAR